MEVQTKVAAGASLSEDASRIPALGASVVLLAVLASGCATTRGPELVANSHIAYNKAVSQVLKQELLLNIVRRRYMEAPQFLNVSSISSNFKTTGRVGAGATVVGIGDDNVWNGRFDGSLEFTDSPTITITPRQGENIARQLHGALKVETIVDLGGAGYPVDFILIMLVEGINNLRGPDLRYDKFRAGSPEWREAIMLLQRFYEEGKLIVDRFRWNDPYHSQPYPAASITPEMWITTLSTGTRRWKSHDGGKTFFFTSHEMAPAIWLDEEVRRSPDGQRLMALLNVQPEVREKAWLLEPARAVRGADVVGKPDLPRSALKLRMRSLYNVLNFYAYCVQVPPEDEREGRATNLDSFRKAVEAGAIRDFSELMTIKSSKNAPEEAHQAVKYRGLWFYIDDRDFESKAGFNALYDLWQLSIQPPSKESKPVTTIQVG